MFDLLVNTMAAWNQAGCLIAAAVCTSLGSLCLGNRLYWRLCALRVSGTIVGVREIGKGMYRPVYSYTLPDGSRAEGTSDTGSSAVSRMGTGRVVRLLVFVQHPQEVAEYDGFLLEIVGAVLTVVGCGLCYYAVTTWPLTPVTWMMLAGIVIYLAAHHSRTLSRKPGTAPSVLAWRQARDARLTASPVVPAEQVHGRPDCLEQRRNQAKINRLALPVLIVAGAALGALGIRLAQSTAALQTGGVRAQGTVVSLELQESSGSSTYHPVVEFSSGDVNTLRFTDRAGSNPPSYRTGEHVTVLYMPQSPRNTAIIDHGRWNWLLPTALCLFGALLILAGARGIWARGRTQVSLEGA